MKKKFFCLITIIVIFASYCYASYVEIDAVVNKKIKIYYEDNLYGFQDVNKQKVYPISYEGTTYLPIRALSSLFNVGIMWNGSTNSIYLGGNDIDKDSAYISSEMIITEPELIRPLLNKDIKIYFKDELQNFYDVNNQQVFPISYNGTTYLPVRAVSKLFDLSITWNGETNSILIEKNSPEKSENGNIASIHDTDLYKNFYELSITSIKSDYDSFVESIGLTSDIDTLMQYMYYTEYLRDVELEIMNEVENLEEELQKLNIEYSSYAQLYYIVANNLSIEEALNQKVFDYTVPASSDSTFVIPKEVLYGIAQINEEAYEKYEKEMNEDMLSYYEDLTARYQKQIAAYEIKGDISRTREIDESLKLYEEEHKLYITSNGYLFSLPGISMELGDSLKLYDANNSVYFMGEISNDIYENGPWEEMEVACYKNPIKSDNLEKFTAIENDGQSHITVLGYSFYNSLGREIVNNLRMMKKSDEWTKSGVYKDSGHTGKKYIIFKNENETFNVYYLEDNKIETRSENIEFDGTLEIINSFGESKKISLSYDVITVDESSNYHNYSSYFRRIEDIEKLDLEKYE